MVVLKTIRPIVGHWNAQQVNSRHQVWVQSYVADKENQLPHKLSSEVACIPRHVYAEMQSTHANNKSNFLKKHLNVRLYAIDQLLQKTLVIDVRIVYSALASKRGLPCPFKHFYFSYARKAISWNCGDFKSNINNTNTSPFTTIFNVNGQP